MNDEFSHGKGVVDSVSSGGRWDGGGRGQAGLPALAIALLVLTVVTGLSLTMANGALTNAQRDAGERRVAASLAAQFVAHNSPLTDQANVLDETRLVSLTPTRLQRIFPVVDGYDVRVRVGGSTVVATGEVTGGTTVRRLVVVTRDQLRTIRPVLHFGRTVTLPRRSEHVTLRLAPPSNTTITAVRANDRVVLANASGLQGIFDIRLSRFETTTLRFSGIGPLHRGNVTIHYVAPQTTKTTLAVTVDG